MSSTQRARIGQVTELTRAVDIPLPAVAPEILELVLEAVAQGWTYIKSKYPDVLQTGEEADISAHLVTWLNAELPFIRGLDLVISSVDRGRESINFDGRRIEVRPDISFRLTHWDARFRLIAECKIIDVRNGKTAALYRDKGIARFVEGDYAWACREAIMLGYVRCGSKLSPAMLQTLKKHPSVQCQSGDLRVPKCAPFAYGAPGTSKHGRNFKYAHSKQSDPGGIELWHLWLDV